MKFLEICRRKKLKMMLYEKQNTYSGEPKLNIAVFKVLNISFSFIARTHPQSLRLETSGGYGGLTKTLLLVLMLYYFLISKTDRKKSTLILLC